MDECLKKQSSFIQTRQIQTILNKYFFKNLQTKINSANRFGPVIDPTAGRLTTWEHWHQDIIPRRTMKIKEYILLLFKFFFILIFTSLINLLDKTITMNVLKQYVQLFYVTFLIFLI